MRGDSYLQGRPLLRFLRDCGTTFVITGLILTPAVAFLTWAHSYWWLFLVIPAMVVAWMVLTAIVVNRRWLSE